MNENHNKLNDYIKTIREKTEINNQNNKSDLIKRELDYFGIDEIDRNKDIHLNFNNMHEYCAKTSPSETIFSGFKTEDKAYFKIGSELNNEINKDYNKTLVFSFRDDSYSWVSNRLMKYLLEKKINAKGEISLYHRNQSMTIDLYENDIDLSKVIKDLSIYNTYLKDLNPFIPRINKIGILENNIYKSYDNEHNKIDYNDFLSKELNRFITSSSKEQVNLENFSKFVLGKTKEFSKRTERMNLYKNIEEIKNPSLKNKNISDFDIIKETLKVILNRDKLSNHPANAQEPVETKVYERKNSGEKTELVPIEDTKEESKKKEKTFLEILMNPKSGINPESTKVYIPRRTLKK